MLTLGLVHNPAGVAGRLRLRVCLTDWREMGMLLGTDQHGREEHLDAAMRRFGVFLKHDTLSRVETVKSFFGTEKS